VLKGATARRYAGAVFELGVESNSLDSWRADLGRLAEYFGNKRLQFVLREPKIPLERKEQVVRDLLEGKVQAQALSLALLLVERNLVDHAPLIYTEFEKRYNEYKGQAVAEITTAIPLDDDLRRQVIGELQQMTGKRILLQERIDPSILGGAIARVGDTLIDGSLKRRFALLRTQIARGGRDRTGQDDTSMFADLFADSADGGNR
jgi:F-type H+-transporting ATPase subunit delta